jgi:ankyrin repeat protein
MWQAAMKGALGFIKALVGLGVDVNEPKDLPDPEDPDAQVEGPILWAASAGHLEVVKWLLQHGAKINYIVDGKPRSLPLKYAATNGHLDVVMLLVENGADINASWNGTNAIQQAENYGHPEVRDFLLAAQRQ